MIPIIVATAIVLLAKARSNSESKNCNNTALPVKTKEDKPASVDAPPETVVKFPTTPELVAANLFVDKYVKLPHVTEVTDFDPDTREYGRVVTYTKRYVTNIGARLWRILAINTVHGNIYLSLMLNDDGSIHEDAAGVILGYDNPGMDIFIQKTHEEQHMRFGKRIFDYDYDKIVRDEELLSFLIGDENHLFSIARYIDFKGDHYRY